MVGEHGIGKSMLAETVVADYLKENKADNRNTFLFWLDYAGEKTFSRFICKLNQKWDPNPGYNSVDNIIQA